MMSKGECQTVSDAITKGNEVRELGFFRHIKAEGKAFDNTKDLFRWTEDFKRRGSEVDGLLDELEDNSTVGMVANPLRDAKKRASFKKDGATFSGSGGGASGAGASGSSSGGGDAGNTAEADGDALLFRSDTISAASGVSGSGASCKQEQNLARIMSAIFAMVKADAFRPTKRESREVLAAQLGLLKEGNAAIPFTDDLEDEFNTLFDGPRVRETVKAVLEKREQNASKLKGYRAKHDANAAKLKVYIALMQTVRNRMQALLAQAEAVGHPASKEEDGSSSDSELDGFGGGGADTFNVDGVMFAAPAARQKKRRDSGTTKGGPVSLGRGFAPALPET